jgi:hypothetical protein
VAQVRSDIKININSGTAGEQCDIRLPAFGQRCAGDGAIVAPIRHQQARAAREWRASF